MSSSPAAPCPVESTRLARPGLLELLEQVSDPRSRRGVRHRFVVIVAVALSAVLAGARSFTAIGEWVADADTCVLSKLGITATRRPCEATIRRVLARVDGDVLDAVLGAWMRARVGLLGGRRVIAIDGKTVRGARAGGHLAPHLVAALDHGLGVVLGQVQVAVQSNEIPALRTLPEAFDLVGAVITADATGTRTATAAYIVGRGGHYVFTVKGNQPGLFARCKTLPWAKIRAASAVEVGHGRRVRRTIKVAAAPVLLDFAGAVQVAQIRRTRTLAGKKSQGHWGIENKLHSGPRRHLRRRPLQRPHGQRTPGHGHLALHRDQRLTPDRDHEHRPRDPTSRPRRPPPRRTTPDLLKHDFAGALCPGQSGPCRTTQTAPCRSGRHSSAGPATCTRPAGSPPPGCRPPRASRS